MQDEVNGYRCVCDIGYNGTECTVNINDCVINACVHGSCVVSGTHTTSSLGFTFDFSYIHTLIWEEPGNEVVARAHQ